jgi:hypothetical protein
MTTELTPTEGTSLLAKTGVVDDPGLDRTVAFQLRKYRLAHLGQQPLVQPLSLADEMQQRLMLRMTDLPLVGNPLSAPEQ